MDTEQIEIQLILEALKHRYGYDFTDYACNTVRRRVLHQVSVRRLSSISELQHVVLNDRSAADALMSSLSINVTEMFRDPSFFLALRKTVIPSLADQDHIKIWHAGCASGQEVYSMAILLKEEGLYDKAKLYGTDVKDAILEKAEAGVMPMDEMKQNTRNYHASGGCQEFAGYYHARYDGAMMNKALKKNIVFSLHNLTSDAPFGIFEVIVCRNVMIYFNQALKERVFQLFIDSLVPGGYLCLGSHETLLTHQYCDVFDTTDPDNRIYRMVKT